MEDPGFVSISQPLGYRDGDVEELVEGQPTLVSRARRVSLP